MRWLETVTSLALVSGATFAIGGCGPSFARVAHFQHGVYGGKPNVCSPDAKPGSCDICWLRGTFTDGDELPFASEQLIGVGSVSKNSAPPEKYDCKPHFESWYGGNDWSWGAPRREALAVLDSMCSPTGGLFYDQVLQSYKRGATLVNFEDELDTDGRLRGTALDTDLGRGANVVGCTFEDLGGARMLLAIEALPDIFFVEAFAIAPRALVPVSYYRSAIANAFTGTESQVAPEFRFDDSTSERGPAATRFELDTAADGTRVRHEYYDFGVWHAPGPRVGTVEAYTAGANETLSALFREEPSPEETPSPPVALTAERECRELEVIEAIRRYRGLLDEAIITPEEFEAIKLRLLSEGVDSDRSMREEQRSTVAPHRRPQTVSGAL